MGEILAHLEEDGLADSTIVVFWSDHGVGMPRAKRFAYESGLREPLIVRWPGVVDPGTVRKDLVYLMDLAPSMLAAAGLQVPAHMHGRPIFGPEGAAPVQPREIVVGARDRMDAAEDTSRTVRDGRFRYIRHFHPDRTLMQHQEYADRFPTWKEFRRLASEEADQRGRGEKPDRLTPLQRRFVAAGKPKQDGRGWQLYTAPVAPPTGKPLHFRAWRLGFRPSGEATLTSLAQPGSEN